MIQEAFYLGGWGMWPTLIVGFLLFWAVIRYIIRPDKRLIPLVISMETITLVSGLLGFGTGAFRSLIFVGTAPVEKHFYVLIGLGESLYNVVFALVFIFISLLIFAIGIALC